MDDGRGVCLQPLPFGRPRPGVRDFVTSQAEAETEDPGGWAGYRDVFLSAEVQDLVRSRVSGAARTVLLY
jgi:hypothetical protein